MNNQMTNQNQAPKKNDMAFDVNGQEVTLSQNIVRKYLVRGGADVTDQEVSMFIQLCRYQELNPFINEAYMIKFKGSPAQLIVSKEAFMKRAENNPNFKALQAGIIVERDSDMIELEGAIKLKADELIGAWARVYRHDREAPVTVKIAYSEFSKGQSTWKQQPMNMIRKTAIVNALREAFPNALGAMYTEDDSQPAQSGPIDITAEVDANANQQALDIEPEQPKPIENNTQTVNTKPKEQDPIPEEENPFANSANKNDEYDPGF